MAEAASWIGYGITIAMLLGAAALVLERGLRQVGRPARAVWLLALAGSLLLPLIGDLRPAPSAGGVLALPVVSLPALEVSSAPDRGVNATSWLQGAWLLTSLGVLLLLVRSHVVLERAARAWRRLELDGGPVWVSDDLGPAVVGLRRTRVVLPQWVLALPEQRRALLLLHEREHARAGDPAMVAAGWLAAIAMPWNPLVWWQVARLRHAVELDCDARVLARGGTVRPYGALLLEVGRRRTARPLLSAAFAERSTRLEQRIRALLEHGRSHRPVRALLLALFGVALLGTAYCVRDPLGGTELPVPPAAAVQEEAVAGQGMQQPELLNAGEVQRSLSERYPALLREAGIGGQVQLWAFIAADGRVQKSQLSRGSGYDALDEAALGVLSLMRFSPARREGQPAGVWIELPIVFGTAGLPRRVGEQPSVTPMTVRPELRNAGDVERALVANYPPLLRDAGIGGNATIWFMIDEQGTVRRTLLGTTSGRGELDEAALRVARTFRFTPAENQGVKVPVWIEVPISFQAK